MPPPRVANKQRFIFTTTAAGGFSRAKIILDKAMLEVARNEAMERGEDADEVAIPHWTFHDLRRTAASGMARLGIHLPVVEKALNHTSGNFRGIVGVYQRHSFTDEKRTALEAWGRFISDIINAQAGSSVVRFVSRAS